MRDLNFREIDYICKSRCFHAPPILPQQES